MVNIDKRLKNKDFGFVLLGKWNNWGKYENKNGKSVLVETKEVNAVDYEKIKSQKEWKPLGKAPYQPGWQKKHIKFDSPELLKHETNIGINGGFGRLRILDIDNVALGNALEKVMNTRTHLTGSGGKHFLFTSDWNENKVLINELGEIRASNYQVVIPPSRHPNGNFYSLHIDKPIREISSEELLSIVKPYLRDSQPQTQTIFEEESSETKLKDESRSGFEMREIIKLILKGFSKPTIWKRMMYYSKWGSAPEQYREKTFQKALEHIKTLTEEKEGLKEENVSLEIYDDKDLLKYEPKKQKWLIENQIPENEIGLLVGKRGHRKTFTAIYQALCLSSGKDCFNDKVPEPKKVIFVSEEDSIDTLVSRIKPLKRGLDLGDTKLLIKYLSFNGLKLDKDNKKFEKFKELLFEYKPDLIIIDALQRCVSFEVDKDNRAISELFTERIRPLVQKIGGTWLFISHLRKTQGNHKTDDPLDEVRGGSELVNYTRFVLSCETPKYQTKNEEGGDFIIFRVLKMSSSQLPDPKVISFLTLEDGTIKVEYEGIPSEVLVGEVQCANAIKDWLFNNQIADFKTKTITDASEEIGFRKTLITLALKVLISRGIISKIKRGNYEVVGMEKLVQEKHDE